MEKSKRYRRKMERGRRDKQNKKSVRQKTKVNEVARRHNYFELAVGREPNKNPEKRWTKKAA